MSPAGDVRGGIRVTAGYAWRLIVIAVAVYLVFVVLAKLTLVAVAMFAGLVICALLRPVVDRLAVVLPRAVAVAVALLLTVVGFGAAFTFIVNSVARPSTVLATQFSGGLNDMERLMAGAPFHIPPWTWPVWVNSLATG